MTLSRRAFVAAGVALAAVPAHAQERSAQRRFRIYRGDSEIGEQTIAISRAGGAVEVEIDISISVAMLGVTVFRYGMTNRERWANGQLQRMEASSFENGDRFTATAMRTGAGLEYDGTNGTGTLTGDIATTTYWTTEFLSRPTWLSTRDCEVMQVTATRDARVDYPTVSGNIAATRHVISGDLDINLYYDDRGEWIGTTFPARGARARYVATDIDDRLTDFWTYS